MTANVQGSASTIGMAPQSMGTAGAAGGTGLPSLTEQLGGAGAGSGAGLVPAAGTGQATQAAGGQQGAAPGATAPGAAAPGGVPGFDINSLAASGRWLGPIMTIGGGAAAIKGFSAAAAATAAGAAATKGGGLLKWGGIAAALGGLALTGIGFKAKGIEVGTQATEQRGAQALNALAAQYEGVLNGVVADGNAKIATLEQRLAAVGAGQTATPGDANPQANPQVDPTTGQPVTGTGTQSGPVGPGLEGTVVPGGTATGTPGVGAPAGTTGTAATGPWSVQSLVGRSVQLQPGSTGSGTVIAGGGSFRIEQVAGDPGGYATLAAANDAARSTMSTELVGSSYLRWMVVEHEGRFYGVIAKQQGAQDQPNPLPADLGNVVAWSAMDHITEGRTNGWQAYTWSKDGGAQAIAVPYGTTSVFPSSTGGAGTAPASTTGGGQVAGPAPGAGSFDPASQVGRSFSVNAATTAEGDVARGGALQVQRFVDSSAGGFGTPEEAAVAARSARSQAGGGDQWKRWMTLQGSDGRFYVYEGSIVKRDTVPLQGAAPLHVFGAGFAEYYDGASSSWKAVRDAA